MKGDPNCTVCDGTGYFDPGRMRCGGKVEPDENEKRIAELEAEVARLRGALEKAKRDVEQDPRVCNEFAAEFVTEIEAALEGKDG